MEFCRMLKTYLAVVGLRDQQPSWILGEASSGLKTQKSFCKSR